MNKNKSNHKRTEIGKVPQNWSIHKLSDYVEINPKRELSKGTMTTYSGMANIKPHERQIDSYETKPYSGGSRFINNDTLLARITPCLENGKTAFVDILQQDEVGFGSTEFIVLSNKPGKTIPKYVYYLSRSPRLRNIAIKSMVGSSGRQRVQTDKLSSSTFVFPKPKEQKQIVSILSSFDDKIELNRKMNQTLEEMGKALFKNWFVDFEFPNENGKPYKSSGGEMLDSELGEIPKGWETKKLKEISEKISKGTTPQKKDIDDLKAYIPFIKVKNLTKDGSINEQDLEKIPLKVHKKQLLRSILKTDDILFSIAGTIGRVSLVDKHLNNSNCNQAVAFIRLADKKHMLKYIHKWIESKEVQNEINASIVQAVQANVSLSTLGNLSVILPHQRLLNMWNSVMKSLYEIVNESQLQIRTLSKIKNYTLPRLMSGRIRTLEQE